MKTRNWFGLIVLLAMHSACNPIFYSPNTQNVALLSEKGEAVVGAALSDNQVGLQANYALNDRLGIQLGGGLFNPSDLDNGNGGSGKFLEGGVGYLHSLNESVVFECYGLLGMGSFENHMPSTIASHPLTTGEISADVLRFGIQPNIGLKLKYFEAALSARFTQVNYSNIEGDLIFEDTDQVEYLSEHKNNLMLEPAVTLRAGIERIKVQLQIGFSQNLTNKDFRQDEGFATIGLIGRFN